MSLCFTSEMVTDCVLGLSAGSFTDKPTPIMQYVKELFNQPWTFLLFFIITSTFPILRKVIKLRFIPPHVEKFFIDLMGKAVEVRRGQLATGKQFERTDFLDYILQLADKRSMDNRQLLAYTMTFLLDGFETTAAVLAHLLLLLGRDQEAQQRLREEIQEHLQDGIIAFDKLADLPYLDACLQGELVQPLIETSNLIFSPPFAPQKPSASSRPPSCRTSCALRTSSCPTRMGPTSWWRRAPLWLCLTLLS